MAWQLQNHMIAYIEPSILAHVTDDKGNVDKGTLAQYYADCHWDEDTGTAGYDLLTVLATGSEVSDLISRIKVKAVEYAATTNGGHEFFIDGFTSIAWCDEDTYLAYYA